MNMLSAYETKLRDEIASNFYEKLVLRAAASTPMNAINFEELTIVAMRGADAFMNGRTLDTNEAIDPVDATRMINEFINSDPQPSHEEVRQQFLAIALDILTALEYTGMVETYKIHQHYYE